VHAASKHQAHHLDYFRFIGRVLGKAVFDGFLMEAHLASTVYKYLLGREIARCDMASVDAVYFKNLQAGRGGERGRAEWEESREWARRGSENACSRKGKRGGARGFGGWARVRVCLEGREWNWAERVRVRSECSPCAVRVRSACGG
jgi:hypothetical protein